MTKPNQSILTVPPGSYGSLPRLVFIQSGKSPNIGSHQLFRASYSSSGNQTPGVSGPNKNNFSRWGILQSPVTLFSQGLGDVQPAFLPRAMVLHSGVESSNDPPLWDSGFTLSMDPGTNSVYAVRGTISTILGTPNVTGINSFFTEDLAIGSRVIGLGGPEVSVISITDNTHMAVSANLPITFTNIPGPTTNSLEDIKWIAALINLPYSRVSQPFPTSQTSDGFETLVTASVSTAQLLNSVNSADGLTGTSLNTSFGPVVTDRLAQDFSTLLTFDDVLSDSACVDAIAIVQGYTTATPPFSIDLVNGNPNWQMIGNVSTTGLHGQFSTFSAMAHWTRSGGSFDTTLTWSGIPPTPPASMLSRPSGITDDVPGSCDIWMWPSAFPGSNVASNRGYVIA